MTIRIKDECYKDECGGREGAGTSIFLESDKSRERDRDCEPRRRDCDKRRDCDDEREEFEEPLILAPVIPVAAGALLITAKSDATTIQVLNNPALVATFTISIAPLGRKDVGNLVITDLGGIIAVNWSGTSGVSSGALASPASSLSLTWNGYAWVPAV